MKKLGMLLTIIFFQLPAGTIAAPAKLLCGFNSENFSYSHYKFSAVVGIGAQPKVIAHKHFWFNGDNADRSIDRASRKIGILVDKLKEAGCTDISPDGLPDVLRWR